MHLQVSNGLPPEVPMIDLRGFTRTEATQRLTEFRDETGIAISWSFTDVTATNPAQNGVVVATTPAPGTPIGPNDAIIVRVGAAP